MAFLMFHLETNYQQHLLCYLGEREPAPFLIILSDFNDLHFKIMSPHPKAPGYQVYFSKSQ